MSGTFTVEDYIAAIPSIAIKNGIAELEIGYNKAIKKAADSDIKIIKARDFDFDYRV